MNAKKTCGNLHKAYKRKILLLAQIFRYFKDFQRVEVQLKMNLNPLKILEISENLG